METEIYLLQVEPMVANLMAQQSLKIYVYQMIALILLFMILMETGFAVAMEMGLIV